MVGGIKDFHYKQKLKQYMKTKPPLQKILQEILHKKRRKQTKPVEDRKY
jgi:hypothetical protein